MKKLLKNRQHINRNILHKPNVKKTTYWIEVQALCMCMYLTNVSESHKAREGPMRHWVVRNPCPCV